MELWQTVSWLQPWLSQRMPRKQLVKLKQLFSFICLIMKCASIWCVVFFPFRLVCVFFWNCCVYNYGIEIDFTCECDQGGISDGKKVRTSLDWFDRSNKRRKQKSRENVNTNLYDCDKMQSERGRMAYGMSFWLCNKIIHSLSSLVKIICVV